ncbi:MAG: hypothetical protein LBM70_10250 [Victivallales bacterium]|jgi:trk system potassium uptake protein TrkH|nr:hypothetical protein [Victivallales bacterium]
MVIGFVKKGQSLFILAFVVLIVVGTLLLKLPWSYAGDLPWVDAFFAATSAVCVTGLASVSVCDFTWFGQLIILLLIQFGGIGIMTLSALILLLLGRGLSFSNTLLMSTLTDNFSLRGTEGLIRTVVEYALFSEAVGFLLLLPGFWAKYAWDEAIWYSVFHSISAFCNAGISPLPDSMIGQARWTQMVIAALIVLGGVGVYVIYDLLMAFRRKDYRLRVHSRVVLTTTLILIVGGTVLLWLNGLAKGTNLSWYDAIFQSISARTAGFNSVDIGKIPPESQMLLIILMLIGGAPGSTAGGMKVSTVALAVASIIGTFKGNPEVRMFKRTIPIANVLRAYTVIVTFILLTCLGAVFLHLLTPERFTMMECFFESASAISTTGLTTGATLSLTMFGKIYLACYMFVGRIGPFTIMLFLLSREKTRRLRYPEERIIIG